jgi:hypothetical protein
MEGAETDPPVPPEPEEGQASDPSADDFLKGDVNERLAEGADAESEAADAGDETRLSTYYPDCPPSVYPACRTA